MTSFYVLNPTDQFDLNGKRRWRRWARSTWNGYRNAYTFQRDLSLTALALVLPTVAGAHVA